MYETLSLMNIRLLLWLNHTLAAHPTLYNVALFVTDEGADIALLLTAAWLWFWPDRPRGAASDVPTVETRSDSRARLLVFGAGGIVAYVTARLIALELDMARPFVTYLPVRGNEGAFAGLRTFGAFPSDHAALLAALPIAFRYWSRRLAIVWAWMAALLCLVRIAIGFHYPSDMLAGAAIGVLCAGTAMAVYDRIARRATKRVALGFAHSRGALVLSCLSGCFNRPQDIA